MNSALFDIEGVFKASELTSQSTNENPWCLESLRTRLIEVSTPPRSASLTWLSKLILEAQRQRETVAWITNRQSMFFPPDLSRRGIDLEQLPFILAQNAQTGAAIADELLKSGGFGLVICDTGDDLSIPRGLQQRLLERTESHRAVSVFVTQKTADWSRLSSFVSLHVFSHLKNHDDTFEARLKPSVDKHRGAQWHLEETYHGPPGLY